MEVVNIIDEDFSNYKKASMFIGFPKCTFKCNIESGTNECQNMALAKAKKIEISYAEIVNRYINNNITSAIVFGGLEPMDSFDDVVKLVDCFRKYTDDDIVIYTGYKEDEIPDDLYELKKYKNIIVKFGRFKPNKNKRFDKLLNLELASDNQYAKKIS